MNTETEIMASANNLIVDLAIAIAPTLALSLIINIVGIVYIVKFYKLKRKLKAN